MAFSPFNANDFAALAQMRSGQPLPPQLDDKAKELRRELCSFPEYNLDFFRKRLVRRGMRGSDGAVFTDPKIPGDKHWFFCTVGGDEDEVQLNVGMSPQYVRVGLGFQMGRQVAPKIPAFRVLQTFLGIRPPLPFRDAFYRCVDRNGFRLEVQGNPVGVQAAAELLAYLETYVVPPDNEPVFVFVGALWDVQQASDKTAVDYRNVFLQLMPFYDELLLAGGRYKFEF